MVGLYHLYLIKSVENILGRNTKLYPLFVENSIAYKLRSITSEQLSPKASFTRTF